MFSGLGFRVVAFITTPRGSWIGPMVAASKLSSPVLSAALGKEV